MRFIDRFNQLEQSLIFEVEELQRKVDATSDDLKRQAFEAIFADLYSSYLRQLLELIESYRDDPDSLLALYILAVCDEDELLRRAIVSIEQYYAHHPEIGEICIKISLSSFYAPERKQLIESIRKLNHERATEGKLKFALGIMLKEQLDLMYRTIPPPPQQRDEILEIFREVINQYRDIYLSGEFLGLSLANFAEQFSYDLQYLQVGQPSPEIEGEDSMGCRVCLSDYRGKNVILCFWSQWCSSCQTLLYTLENLARKNSSLLAILGVNSDIRRETLQRLESKYQLTWRSLWDGEYGPIARRWNISTFPTLYLIDYQGIIRFRYASSDDLLSWVETFQSAG